MTVSQDRAEAIALKALAFLVSDEDLLPVFMGSSGVSSEDLRSGASDPAFLGSVLDFILMDDQWVVRFCDQHKLDYHEIHPARYSLPGGEQVNWT
ncbi:MAG: DUF3572 domain-containing protein [Paracoccaceae bacterium]|nr:DUF3572 domain-containing protein [Paracoccaceae bacterium]MDG1737558.1 DUF3572 domain-containing protein [Paracoccaceae bacterium]MDG2257472.1 DUF3572 domain-containing protein [Paracoccaceae bacterium]